MASTSIVPRGSPAASSVIRRPVTQPPTKTNSGSSGRRASAAAMSWSRFGSRICLLKTTMKFLFGVLSLARTPVPERVGQSQVFVECRVAYRSGWRGLVQRLECDAALFSLWIGPHWNRLITLPNYVPQRFGGIRGRNAAGKFSPLSRERVLQSMHQELLQSRKVWTVQELRAVDQLRGLSAFYGSMYLRCAHPQFTGELRVRPSDPGSHDLQHHVHVLWLQNHISILHSRIANSECQTGPQWEEKLVVHTNCVDSVSGFPEKRLLGL